MRQFDEPFQFYLDGEMELDEFLEIAQEKSGKTYSRRFSRLSISEFVARRRPE